MNIKEKLLTIFEENQGKYFSGEELAKMLDVSRNAVWKSVNALRENGYKISAVTNKGYCLSKETDILSRQGISKYLDDENKSFDISVFETIDSTNTFLKEKAALGAKEGTFVIANQQTKGRGRQGKNFFSPDKSGIYMSLLLRPSAFAPEKSLRITTMAAVAMCEAIMDNSDITPKIKWVNDILVDGKKVCGILTEGSFSMENGNIEYAVLGLGVNLYRPNGGFPEDIENIAGFVFDNPQNDIKNRIAASFINHFMYYYRSENFEEYTEKYRKYSAVIGKNVTVISGNYEESAKVLSIDDQCRLKVLYPDGHENIVSYGEIRIKL